MGKKRKLDIQAPRAVTSGPVDFETNQRSAFPVELTCEDVTADVPLDGLDYLRLVRNEAKTTPSFTFSKKKKVTGNIAATIQTTQIPKGPFIDSEWRIEFLSRFRRLRQRMSSTRTSRSNFPGTQNDWLGYISLSSPTYQNVRGISNPIVIQFLRLSTYWLENEYTVQLPKWIFAFLMRVEDTLECQDVSVLRDLVKKAWDLRDTGNLEFRAICEMIIVIVSEIFGQHDLRDIYEP